MARRIVGVNSGDACVFSSVLVPFRLRVLRGTVCHSL